MRNPHIIRRLKYRLNLYRGSKKSRSFFKPLLIFILVLFLFVFSFYKIEERLFSLAERLAFSHLQNYVSRECNLCIGEIIKENNIDFSTLLSSNTTGSLSSLSADYSELNILKTEVSDKITSYINDLKYLDCKIPSGALLSDGIFAGYGFNIPVRLIVSGAVYADFDDEFISSGINQTKYRLSINVTVTAELHTVFNTKESTFTTEIPLTERIIVGEVPNVMLERE